MLLLQHTEIKASFEKSKMVVQHSFWPSECKELHENVSITTLKKLHDEIKQVTFIGIDPFACGCQLRHTHGLPCAHKIADHNRHRHSIPLNSMHPFWHKLDMLPRSNRNNISQDDIPSDELDLFKQVYTQAGQSGKAQMLRKLNALVNSECTHVEEPVMKSTM